MSARIITAVMLIGVNAPFTAANIFLVVPKYRGAFHARIHAGYAAMTPRHSLSLASNLIVYAGLDDGNTRVS